MEISTYFEQIEDYRVVNRCLHSLSDILGLILLGTLASCDDYSEIIDFGYDYQDELCKCLGFSFENGIPSADTLERMMGRIDPNHLESAFKSCLEDLNLVGKHVAFDGKELRGTIPSGKKKAEIQMVNAWVNDYEISVGQQRISKKSNEITAIPELLDLFDYTGSIITIDAIGCQKSIINKIMGVLSERCL